MAEQLQEKPRRYVIAVRWRRDSRSAERKDEHFYLWAYSAEDAVFQVRTELANRLELKICRVAPEGFFEWGALPKNS